MTSKANEKLKKYFDRNTPLFIKIGRSSASANIHRAVWGNGVTNDTEAMTYVNKIILDEINSTDTSETLRILDLGCGVGASVFYLANGLLRKAEFTGISISKVQIEYARKFHRQDYSGLACEFIEADFHELPDLPLYDFIYLVEAFVLSYDPDRLLSGIQKRLKPGGKLIICDDFLTEGDGTRVESDKLLAAFVEGWHIGSLWKIEKLKNKAENHGLTLAKNTDLTPYLNLWTLRDKMAHFFLYLYKLLPVKSIYWESVRGGDALQKCLIRGLINYRFLVFTKS